MCLRSEHSRVAGSCIRQKSKVSHSVGSAVGSSSQRHTQIIQAVCMAHLQQSMHGLGRWASSRAPRTPRALSTDVSSSRTTTSTSTSARQQKKQQAKSELLSWISGTKRGSNTDKLLRGQIEEAQVGVEAFSPAELDYSLLEGKWLLQYTDALDVTPIVGLELPYIAGFPPPVSVGAVYQRFSNVEAGLVENIIEFSLPFWLEEQKGCTFTVQASYDVASPRRIRLIFNQAEVGQLRINPTLETLLAPALLPRGALNQQLLLALREFKLTFPFRSAQQVVQGTGAAASYLLTYLDEDMLIGRGPQGTFIFSRVHDDSRVGDDS